MFSFIKKIIIGIFSYFKDKRIVSHIRLTGVIGNVGKFKQGIDFSSQQEIIKKAFSVEKIEAVAISINSPGGSPVQSHLIYSYVKKMAKKKNVKVLVFAEDVAASGGYLIACAGDEIYANSSSIIGSIGVIYSSFGLQELIKKIGIERRVYTSGKSKSFLDPFKVEKKEDIKRLKIIQEQIHENFISYVKNRRGLKLKKNKQNEIFSGLFWVGKQAIDLGLAYTLGAGVTWKSSVFWFDSKGQDVGDADDNDGYGAVTGLVLSF